MQLWFTQAAQQTHTHTGSEIDFFLVSNELLVDGYTIDVLVEACFTPHLPVLLRLGKGKGQTRERRICQPRLMPTQRLIGPVMPSEAVDWDGWAGRQGLMDDRHFDEDRIEEALTTWYAGAEVELIDTIGISGDEKQYYRGIGQRPEYVQESKRGRYRNADDKVGILGQRLAWCAAGLNRLYQALRAEPLTRRRINGVELVRKMGHRAVAIRRDLAQRHYAEEDAKDWQTALAALGTMINVNLHRHGAAPILGRGALEREAVEDHGIHDLLARVSDATESLAKRRRKASMKAERFWARTAAEKVAHAVTKPSSFANAKSASADKGHVGECSNQRAADRGIVEWGNIWQHNGVDCEEHVSELIDKAYDGDGGSDAMEEIMMTPITAEKILRGSMKFKGSTAVGCDFLRIRLLMYLSAEAREALAALLNVLERHLRWPRSVREVTEVALQKKSGGARLVGIAAGLYRLWTKIRFLDIRERVEQRISRHYLPAAPGRGASKAIFDLAFTAEAAHAQGREAAATTFDLKSYYEQIGLEEVVKGCRRFGLPRAVTALACNLYTAPRRIRVGRAYSTPALPRRSILAGCTFALIIIRVISIIPIDLFLRQAKQRFQGWVAALSMFLYVDDGVVMTCGDLDAVRFLHVWITKAVLSWVAKVLGKEVAKGKTACVASSREVKRTLEREFADMDINVLMKGELLGTDFTAGGQAVARPVQMKRRRKANARRGRLGWWRNRGGKTSRITAGGTSPSQAYGSDTNGIPDALMYDMRRLHVTSARVKCKGASLTGRLAVGGDGYQEHDPEILFHNPPLGKILEKIWDEPWTRSDMVRSWYSAREEVGQAAKGKRWAVVRGPVGGAYAHCLRVGVVWQAPFRITALDEEIDLLSVPPRQVMMILKRHARRHLDTQMLRHLCRDHNWNEEEVLARYRHGVDWDLIRDMLKSQRMSAKEKSALLVSVCHGHWTGERLWQKGLRDQRPCDLCNHPIADELHAVHECEAMAFSVYTRFEGDSRCIRNLGRDLAPLLLLGIPPVNYALVPVDLNFAEGALSMTVDGLSYGDGSGVRQQSLKYRFATWAIVRGYVAYNGEWRTQETMRGIVSGWTSTAHRGELKALVEHLRHAGLGAVYVGDCKAVLDGVRDGISRSLTAAANPNADLWREAKKLVEEHGAPPLVRKTKAHRSKNSAVADQEDGVEHWLGNDAADRSAKALAHQLADADKRPDEDERLKSIYRNVIERVAYGTAWRFQHRSKLQVRQSLRADMEEERGQLDENEQHRLRKRGDGTTECQVCRRMAAGERGLRRLRTSRCQGDIAATFHYSHDVRHNDGVWWCRRCGAFSSRWPRRLLTQCSGAPRSEAQRNVLNRLRSGRAPTTAGYLAGVRDLEAASDAGAVATIRDERVSQAKFTTAGRYLRLKGGPLHPGTALVEDQSRRPPDDAPRPAEPQARGTHQVHQSLSRPTAPPVGTSLCHPSRAEGWAARIRGVPMRSRGACTACSRATLTRCRQCGRPLCIVCAKGALHCNSYIGPPG